MKPNNRFLCIDCATMMAALYVNGVCIGEAVISTDGPTNREEWLWNIEMFRSGNYL